MRSPTYKSDGAPSQDAATKKNQSHQSAYTAGSGDFFLSMRDAIAQGDAAHGGAVAALLDMVETACSNQGGILDHDAPERQVLAANLADLVRVLGVRPQDSVPKLAFNCPRCAGPAQVDDAVTWACHKCKTDGTRWTLALHVLASPALLREFLLVVPTRSPRTSKAGAS